MTIRARQPKRVKAITPQGNTWEREVTDALNTLPALSTFSYDDPNNFVAATPGTMGSNVKDGATSLWVKTSGDTETGWQSLATSGVYDLLSDLSTRIANRYIVQGYYTPSEISFVADDGNSGTTSDIANWLDGNVVTVEEKAATPGFDTRFYFSDMTQTPETLFLTYRYDGTPSSHEIDLQAYDYVAGAFKTFSVVNSSWTVTADFSVPDPSLFLQNGAAIIRVVHVTGGNASHDIHYDYVALHYEVEVI